MDRRAGTNGRILTGICARQSGVDQALIRWSGPAETMLTVAFYPPWQRNTHEYGMDFPTEYKPGPDWSRVYEFMYTESTIKIVRGELAC